MDSEPATTGSSDRVLIDTPRLVLQGVDPAQAEMLAVGRCPLPCAVDYPHEDTSAAARLLRQSIEVDNWVPGFGMYLIIRREDGLVVGDIGFHTPPDERGAAEVAYGVAPSARNRGLASEALEALTRWAHAHGCATVVAEVEPDNTASLKVLARCGYLPLHSPGPWIRLRHQSG